MDRHRTRQLVLVVVTVVLGVVAAASAFASCSGEPAADPEPASTSTAPTTPQDPGSTTTVVSDATPDAAPGDAALADPTATGRELAQRFLNILGNPNPTPLLEEFLSPAFQLQRSNGTFANRDEYLDQPASVARFTILDEGFRAYQEGPALTVRFNVSIEEQIDGADLRVTNAQRLGVFLRTASGWQLLAWSNFNPVAS